MVKDFKSKFLIKIRTIYGRINILDNMQMAEEVLYYKSDEYFRSLPDLDRGIKITSQTFCNINSFKDYYSRFNPKHNKVRYVGCDEDHRQVIHTNFKNYYENTYVI